MRRRDLPTAFHATAPMRLDFAGGWTDVPPLGALTGARQETVSAQDVADHAWQVETIEAGLPGGKQDQYAAALGGFHRLSFRDPDVGVEPVTLDPGFAAALERQTLICYTNKSRVSGDTISRVMGAYERGDPNGTGALHGLKETGSAMAEALRAADLARVAALLSENWKHQQALDPGMRTAEMAQLEAAARQSGALGGKAAGAGAGGCMFFVLRGDPRDAASTRAAGGAGGVRL